jgi:hypothetical protein
MTGRYHNPGVAVAVARAYLEPVSPSAPPFPSLPGVRAWAFVSCATAMALGILAVGCERQPAEPEALAPGDPPAAEAPAPEEDALARADAAATELGRTLKERLMAAMAEGGPPMAMTVCADEAQALTAQVGERTGAAVGRSSLRLRNPRNEGPAWVRTWLTEQGDRPAAQAQPLRRVEGGRARVVRPIGTEGPCVTCHGPPEAIPEGVRALLQERYPDDQATGFREGDLRGALWAEVPL